MTTYDRLLAEVIASPADDAPRLILADWLEENGEAARGEFIRVQCELAKIGDNPRHAGRRWCDCRYCTLHRRKRELLEAHAHRWDDEWRRRVFGDAPAMQLTAGWRWQYRRGFVAEVELPLAAWWGEKCPDCRLHAVLQFSESDVCSACHGTGLTGRHGPALVRAAPLEVVRLSDREPHPLNLWDVDQLGQLPLPIYKLLPCRDESQRQKRYLSRQAALGALSAALLAWASSVEQP